VTREKERPEDSIRLRVVVAAMVMVALVAVIAQGATDTPTWIGAVLLVPLGYAFSYFQRDKTSVGTKVVLVVGLLTALGGFLQSVRFAQSVDQARIPLASLFVWVQVLHSFDVPRRRDLSFSVVSSLILVAEAGALSFGTGFLVFLVPWAGLGALWLYLSQRPARDAVPEPSFVRRIRRANRGLGVATARSLAAGTTAVLATVAVVFMLTPRLPGAFVRLPPFAVRTAISVPGFQGQVANPGLPSGGGDGGVVDFSPSVYPGFGSNVDLRARGRLSDDVVMRVRSPQAALWRGQAYDVYDGTTWTASETGTVAVGQDFEQSFQIPSGPSDAPTRRIVTTFYVQADQPNIVFAAYAPEQVYFPAPVLTVDRYDSIHSPILLDPGLIYSVVSTIPITTPSILRAAPAVWSKAETNQYTQLPADLPGRDVALAERITAAATTTYGKVMAVQDWLHRNTRYNLDIPRDPTGRGRGRRVPVRPATGVLRAHRERDGGVAAIGRHPHAPRDRVRAGQAEPVHRLLRRPAVRCARLARGPVPRRGMGAVRPDVRGALGGTGAGRAVHRARGDPGDRAVHHPGHAGVAEGGGPGGRLGHRRRRARDARVLATLGGGGGARLRGGPVASPPPSRGTSTRSGAERRRQGVHRPFGCAPGPWPPEGRASDPHRVPPRDRAGRGPAW